MSKTKRAAPSGERRPPDQQQQLPLPLLVHEQVQEQAIANVIRRRASTTTHLQAAVRRSLVILTLAVSMGAQSKRSTGKFKAVLSHERLVLKVYAKKAHQPAGAIQFCKWARPLGPKAARSSRARRVKRAL